MTRATIKPARAVSATSAQTCANCRAVLKYEPRTAFADQELPPTAGVRRTKFDGPDGAEAHAAERGRSMVRMHKNHLGAIHAYSYLQPGDRPGYQRNGAFCSLRCGFRFGLVAHASGWRLAPAAKEGGR